MKYIHTKYWVMGILLATVASCTKVHNPPGTASLNIVNAVVGSKPILPIFTNDKAVTYFRNAIQLNYNSLNLRSQFTGYSGTQQLALYQYPDTLKSNPSLFNLTLDLPVGSIQTLFLTGTVNTPDTLFTRDAPPYYPPADSSTGIRFVNLSQGSAPISINIAGKTKGSEVSRLPYKGITTYHDYEIGKALFENYVFEFRDAASGALIASYAPKDINISGASNALQLWLYRSFTLALIGLPGGTGADAQTILLVPHTFR